MKQYVLTILFILFCQASIASDPPVYRHGQLRVDGAHIVDQHGQKVMLKGVSLGWHNWCPQFYNPSVVTYLSRSWNIAIIRVAMGVEPAGGYLDSPEESTVLVKKVVDAAIANGIYVIIDWHSHAVYTEQSEVFFAQIAQQYAGSPNIIYEIFNEPVNTSWEEIKAYSIRVIKVIRRYDKQNLIIIGTPNWSQDVDVAANDPIERYDNLVYALHFYAASHGHPLMSKASSAVSKGLPLFVSECSPAFANGDGILDKENFSHWLDFLKKNDISFLLWGLYDKGESSAMLTFRANQEGNWPTSQLTEMGIYARRIVSDKMGPSVWVSIIGALFILAIVFVLIRKRN